MGYNRLTLHHVESHVDKKKDELGNKRIPNAIQKMNIEADKLAEDAYRVKLPWLNKRKLESRMYAQIYMHNNKVTGHWRRQLEEQLKIDRTKTRAKHNPYYWGVNTDEISWRYMRKTVKKTTIAERKKIMAHMHGKRATKFFLKKCGIVESAECHQCNLITDKQIRKEETDRHAICLCTNQRAPKGRALTTALIKKHLSDLIDPYSSKLIEWIYSNNKDTGRARDMKIRHAPKLWKDSYNKEGKRSLSEKQQGLIVEIIMNMDNPMPIWSGIITKAHIKLLKNAGIPQANMIKTIKYIRETLKEHSRTLWKHRCVTLEKETKINKKITTAEAKNLPKN